jgi:signal transduction histidine kinase
LDFGRENTSDTNIAVNDIILGTKAMIGPFLDDHNVDLKFESGASLPHLFGNRQDFMEVLMNLLMNSLHAVTEPERGKVIIRSKRKKGGVQIEVSDNGSGIPEEAQPHIFDLHFTTKPDQKGTGLGLAIVKEKVEKFGGTISFESEVGKGTSFRVFFPASE